MSWSQLLPAVVWIAIGSAIAVGAYNLGLGALNRPGPGLFPFVIGLGIALLSLSIAAGAFRTAKASTTATATEPAHAWAVIAVVAALIFYTVALERIGFMLCTVLFLITLLTVLGRSSWLIAGTVSAGITVGSYLIFAKLLKINLPVGPFGF